MLINMASDLVIKYTLTTVEAVAMAEFLVWGLCLGLFALNFKLISWKATLLYKHVFGRFFL